MKFGICHFIPFFLLFRLQTEINISLPKISENSIIIYYAIAALSVIYVMSKMQSPLALEEIFIILSAVALQKTLLNTFNTKDSPHVKDKDLIHPVVIITLLISLKYNIVDFQYVKYMYVALLCYSILALYIQEKVIIHLMLDYFVVHALFYFLRN